MHRTQTEDTLLKDKSHTHWTRSTDRISKCVHEYRPQRNPGQSSRKYWSLVLHLSHQSEQCDWLRIWLKSKLRLKYFRELGPSLLNGESFFFMRCHPIHYIWVYIRVCIQLLILQEYWELPSRAGVRKTWSLQLILSMEKRQWLLFKAFSRLDLSTFVDFVEFFLEAGPYTPEFIPLGYLCICITIELRIK